MSAIAGLYFLDDRPVDPMDLRRMLQRLAHRGPDGSDVWSEGPIGLGHAMLWTTPESLREKLPLRHAESDLAITADARIDNRDALIAELGLAARVRDGLTDSELILLAYEKWDEACPARLLGDFAFAIWDGRNRTIFCARDHFGVKPFYYYRSDRLFAFASEIKGLLSRPDVPRRLNEVRVADYLVPMFEDKEITFYQGILRLPPAHSMTVSRTTAPMKRYWALDPTREIRYRSNEEYADAFKTVFTEAVRCRLRSAYPIGSMLSGGLDSSSVVCVARDLLARDGARRLHTFSAVFNDVPECDESAYFNAVIGQGGVEAHYVAGERIDPRSDLACLLRHEDEPFSAPYAFLYGALYRAAREHGVRVLLDGIDGDATVSHGVAYLTELARSGRWVQLAREAAAFASRRNRSIWGVLRQWVVQPLAPQLAHSVWRTLNGRHGPPWGTDTIVCPSFARRIGLADRYAAMRTGRQRPARTSKEDHVRWLTWGVHPFLLEVIDRTAAAFGVEPRHVCFDTRLAEFCLALPADQKLSDGWTRVVMRRAMADALPLEVRSRVGKSDISPGLIRSLLDFDGRSAHDVILADAPLINRYVDVSAVHSAYDRYVSDGSQNHAMKVWWAATLATWLRTADVRP